MHTAQKTFRTVIQRRCKAGGRIAGRKSNSGVHEKPGTTDFDAHRHPGSIPGLVHLPFRSIPLLTSNNFPFAALWAASWPVGFFGSISQGAPEYSQSARFIPIASWCWLFMRAVALFFRRSAISSALRVVMASCRHKTPSKGLSWICASCARNIFSKAGTVVVSCCRPGMAPWFATLPFFAGVSTKRLL
jgi:hypothetical protein